MLLRHPHVFYKNGDVEDRSYLVLGQSADHCSKHKFSSNPDATALFRPSYKPRGGSRLQLYDLGASYCEYTTLERHTQTEAPLLRLVLRMVSEALHGTGVIFLMLLDGLEFDLHLLAELQVQRP